jgi:hypothetical protein
LAILDKNGRPIIKQANMIPAGTSGTDISGGRFFEEYLDALDGSQSADIWDEMRRGDDQVAMLLGLIKNLIISARWFVAPVDDSEEEKRIAEFVSFVLFDDMGTESHPKTFDKFKNEALTFVEFGYSLFEITNRVVLDDPELGAYIGFKGVDWRSPKTIEEWDISRGGELLRVQQIDNSQNSHDNWMDGRFLLHIAHSMEGDNYEGISMLRPVYGNWLRKNIMLKLQMIGMERAATGVPIGEIPQGQENSTSKTVLEDSLSRFTAHERQYLIHPEGYNVTSLKIEHDADKVDKAIQREDRAMAKRFMAGFLELGLSGGGAFALGTDWSDLFLSGLEVHAGTVTTSVNTKLIPMLVRQNFGKRRKYPKMKIEGINDKAGKEFAEIMQTLKTNGLLQVTDELKEVIHKRYNLPDFDRDIVEEEPPDGAATATPETPPAKAALSEIKYNLAEPSVGRNIEKVGKEMTKIMSDQMKTRGEKLVSQMMEIWRNAPKAQRMKQVNRLSVPGKNEYKRLMSNILAEVYVQATDGVKKELSKDGLKLAEQSEVKELPAESKAAGASQADLITESQDADLRKNLFFSFTSKADTLPTEAQMNANLLRVVDRYVTGASIRTAGPNAVANAVNLARNAVFQKKETLERIESFIFTNPSPEAPICIELAGRVFTKEEYVVSDKLPPLHHHCNSWIKAQISGRAGNRPVSPAGLTIQGTDKQIEQIEKSIRF